MGVLQNGIDMPIIIGAEKVLVTGKVLEGDYIITSSIIGHGKGVKPSKMFSGKYFGKVIAQALESGDGKSYLIKCMIRKM